MRMVEMIRPVDLDLVPGQVRRDARGAGRDDGGVDLDMHEPISETDAYVVARLGIG
jgi:hypothetical protein